MEKKEIKRILEQLNELPLPEKERILKNCPAPGCDSVLPADRCAKTAEPLRRSSIVRKIRPLAVSCVLLAVVLTGVLAYALAMEQKEYKEAVEFFEEYDLETEGLTREEIRKVYRDISTGSFTYGKTAEVLENSIRTEPVEGYEISESGWTPQEVQALWEARKKETAVFGAPKTGYAWDWYWNGSHFEYSVFGKYTNGVEEWSNRFDGFSYERYVVADDKVIVYGYDLDSDNDAAWLFVLNDTDGQILWETKMKSGETSERIKTILCEEDEFSVFSVGSEGDSFLFCYYRFAYDGTLLVSHTEETESTSFRKAARLGDGYVVLVSIDADHDKIMKIDSQGTFQEEFTYTEEETNYYITDMIEYQDKLYLSAFSVPIYPENKYHSGDFSHVIARYTWDELLRMSDEEYTELVKSYYTAVLLVCDGSSGIPETFYAVAGAVGGALASDAEGRLVWECENIGRLVFHDPSTINCWFFVTGGMTYIDQYYFNAQEDLVGIEKTEKTGTFSRGFW